MAKTSDLTEITSAADDDLIMVVDVDDTTMAPTGTNKKIQKSNLVSSGGGGGPVLIDTQTPTGGVITFTGLDLSAYKRVIIKGHVKDSTVSGFSQWMTIEINNNTTVSNYENHYAYWENAALQQAEGNNLNLVRMGTSNTGGDPQWVRTTIEIELGTGGWYPITARYAGAIGTQRMINGTSGMTFESTSPITEIEFGSAGTNLLGELQLYGEA